MTKRDWAILGCRILAMYLFITRLASLIEALALLGQAGGAAKAEGEAAQGTWLLVLEPLLVVVFACLVWWQAPNLGWTLIGETPQAATSAAAAPGGLDRQGAMEVAFVVLGVYLLTRGLGELGPGIYGLVWGSSHGVDWKDLLGPLLQPGILAVLGLCLLIGGRGIASLVCGVRSGGAARADAQAREGTAQVAPGAWPCWAC